MNRAQKLILITLILAMVTLACNSPSGTGLSDADEQATAVAETVAAKTGEENDPDKPNPPDPPPAAPGADTPTATHTAEPSHTPQPTATTPPTNTPPPTVTSVPCNRASFVSDVNYPDESEITIDLNFTKTWRLQNTGSCTWTSGYKIIFSHGDRMDAPGEVQLTGGTVAPGQTVDVSVNLKAPHDPGTYKGYFKLKSSDGAVFGIGAAGSNPFWTEIKAVPAILLLPPLLITPLVFITPDANVTYIAQRACSGKYRLYFRVESTGTATIESYDIKITANPGSITTTNSGNMFGAASQCISLAVGDIPPGESAYANSGDYNFQLIGSNVTATIKLYMADNQGGFSVEKTLHFIE